MTRLMPEDWRVAAYDAALRGDHDAMVAAIGELSTYGRSDVEKALRSWMACTETAMFALAKRDNGKATFSVEVDADVRTGQPLFDPVVAWARQLFLSHISHNDDSWETLFDAVADGQELTDAVYTTLRMLANTVNTTNDRYTQLVGAGHPGTTRHDLAPAQRTARMVRAHLN